MPSTFLLPRPDKWGRLSHFNARRIVARSVVAAVVLDASVCAFRVLFVSYFLLACYRFVRSVFVVLGDGFRHAVSILRLWLIVCFSFTFDFPMCGLKWFVCLSFGWIHVMFRVNG